MVKWYLGYGRFVLVSSGLNFLLEWFDDFWATTALGYAAGGLYSRAYEYAGYPHRAISKPLMPVFFPAYAQVQDDRERLSKTFFRVNSLIVRVGFLFAGAFALVAPEFVRIFPGEKWMPMVTAFQLMVVLTLFSPLVSSTCNLALAVGSPQYDALGIDGIAIAADVMLLLGIVLTFSSVRQYVDFSWRRLLGWPLVGLALALAATLPLAWIVVFPGDCIALLGKAGLFGLVYVGALLLAERKEYVWSIHVIWNLLRERSETD
jgi:O-antigen/teichoic acid export membrane protein